MRKTTKIVSWSIVGVAILFLVWLVVFASGCFMLARGVVNSRPTPENMQDVLDREIIYMEKIIHYLNTIDAIFISVCFRDDEWLPRPASEYGEITFTRYSGALSEKQHISDNEIRKIARRLDSYGRIGRENNAVRFVRWATRNNSRGIAYTMDGEAPQIEFLTYFLILETPNEAIRSGGAWFYYEVNFSEYRRR